MKFLLSAELRPWRTFCCYRLSLKGRTSDRNFGEAYCLTPLEPFNPSFVELLFASLLSKFWYKRLRLEALLLDLTTICYCPERSIAESTFELLLPLI